MTDQTADGMNAHERALLRLSTERHAERHRLLQEARELEQQIDDITRRYRARIEEMRREAEQLRIDGNGLHCAAVASQNARERVSTARQRPLIRAGQRQEVAAFSTTGRRSAQ